MVGSVPSIMLDSRYDCLLPVIVEPIEAMVQFRTSGFTDNFTQSILPDGFIFGLYLGNCSKIAYTSITWTMPGIGMNLRAGRYGKKAQFLREE